MSYTSDDSMDDKTGFSSKRPSIKENESNWKTKFRELAGNYFEILSYLTLAVAGSRPRPTGRYMVSLLNSRKYTSFKKFMQGEGAKRPSLQYNVKTMCYLVSAGGLGFIGSHLGQDQAPPTLNLSYKNQSYLIYKSGTPRREDDIGDVLGTILLGVFASVCMLPRFYIRAFGFMDTFLLLKSSLVSGLILSGNRPEIIREDGGISLRFGKLTPSMSDREEEGLRDTGWSHLDSIGFVTGAFAAAVSYGMLRVSYGILQESMGFLRPASVMKGSGFLRLKHLSQRLMSLPRFITAGGIAGVVALYQLLPRLVSAGRDETGFWTAPPHHDTKETGLEYYGYLGMWTGLLLLRRWAFSGAGTQGFLGNRMRRQSELAIIMAILYIATDMAGSKPRTYFIYGQQTSHRHFRFGSKNREDSGPE